MQLEANALILRASNSLYYVHKQKDYRMNNRNSDVRLTRVRLSKRRRVIHRTLAHVVELIVPSKSRTSRMQQV